MIEGKWIRITKTVETIVWVHISDERQLSDMSYLNARLEKTGDKRTSFKTEEVK